MIEMRIETFFVLICFIPIVFSFGYYWGIASHNNNDEE